MCRGCDACRLRADGDRARQLQRGLPELIQQLTRAAYSELIDDSVALSINIVTPLGRDWHADGITRVQIQRFDAGSHAAPKPSYESLVEGIFQAANGRLETVRFKGPYAESPAARKLESQALAHPDWSDSEMNAALEDAGGKVAMAETDEFLRIGGIERIAAVFGRVLSTNTRFLWRRQIRPRTEVNVTPRWVVDLEVDDVRGERRCHVLAFDPVTLRLNFVLAFECRTEAGPAPH